MKNNSFPVYFEHAPTNWWFVTKRRVVQEVLRRMRRSAPLGRTVDLGCGTGEILAALEDPEALGVDISTEALGYCRRRGLTRLLQADSQRLPLRAGSLDTILCFDHMEHLVDDAGFLATTARLLRPGGRIVLTVPAHQFLWSPRDVEIHHYRRYGRKGLRRLAEDAGLEVRRVTNSNMILVPLLAVYCLYRRLTGWRPVEDTEDADLYIPPRWLNGLLKGLLWVDSHLLRIIDLPFGTSLLLVGRRPAAAVPPPVPAAGRGQGSHR